MRMKYSTELVRNGTESFVERRPLQPSRDFLPFVSRPAIVSIKESVPNRFSAGAHDPHMHTDAPEEKSFLGIAPDWSDPTRSSARMGMDMKSCSMQVQPGWDQRMGPRGVTVMKNKRTIKARDVVRDVREGMSDAELKAKYQITHEKLREILDKLVAARLLACPGTEELRPANPTVQDGFNRRGTPRCHTVVQLPVYDLDDLLVEGYLREITEDGLQASGIEVTQGDHRSLLIRPDEFADIYPFLVDVECRWSRQDDPEGPVAGFLITNITEESTQELRKLLQCITLCD